MLKLNNTSLFWRAISLAGTTLFPIIFYAQCGPVIPEPDCNSPGAVEIFEGAVIGMGQTFIVTSLATLNTVTVNGGTLIICSGLNIHSLNFTSGTIAVTSSGALNLTNGGIATVFGNSCNLINFGSIVSQSSIVTGPNNLIYNYSPASSFNIPFNQMVVQGPNSQVINNGLFNSSFIVNSSNNTISPFCLGASSITTTGIMINQYPIGFLTPNPYACLMISNTIMNSQTLTNTSNTAICYNAGSVSVIGSPLFGPAIVNNACNSCYIPLGIDGVNMDAFEANECIQVLIELSTIEDVLKIELERLNDGNMEVFSKIYTINEKDLPDPDKFVFLDHNVEPNNLYYYRLLISHKDGETSYSDVVSVRCSNGKSKIYPNPSGSAEFHLADKVEIFSVTDLVGKNYSFDIHFDSLKINGVSSGNVFLVSGVSKGKFFTEKIIVNGVID